MVKYVKAPKTFSMAMNVMVGVLIIHIVLLPVLYLTIIDIYKKNTEEQFIGHVREVIGLLSDVISASESIEGSNKPVLLMESALLSGEVIYIELVEKNGNRLLPEEGIAMFTGEFIEDRYLGEHRDGVYFISVPLQLQLGEAIYTSFRIGFDESVVVDRLNIVKQRSLMILSIYFICIIIMVSYLTSVIMRPLKVLRDWSKTVAAGETSSDLSLTTHISEVRHLSEDLESMRLSLVELAERMQYKAMHDELTGLPNRSLNNDRINRAVSRAGREKSSFAVLLLDLDRFKDINDTLGKRV